MDCHCPEQADAEYLITEEEILPEYPQIEVVQIQFNYVDYEDAAVESRKCYETCRKFGKPVIVMEPVKGGSLVNLPAEAKQISIPDLFACMNAKKQYQDWNSDYYYHNVHTIRNGRASDCIKCGKCEQICPQHLNIRELLIQVAEQFDK